MGILHTTWNTLTKGMPCVTLVALGGFESIDLHDWSEINAKTAQLLRKVMPPEGNYEMAGRSKTEICDIC